jgi:hypothetical protein
MCKNINKYKVHKCGKILKIRSIPKNINSNKPRDRITVDYKLYGPFIQELGFIHNGYEYEQVAQCETPRVLYLSVDQEGGIPFFLNDSSTPAFYYFGIIKHNWGTYLLDGESQEIKLIKNTRGAVQISFFTNSGVKHITKDIRCVFKVRFTE